MIAYDASLEITVRASFPLRWATLQNNLGNAFRVLARCGADIIYLGKAKDAYWAALEERTRDLVPMEWAGTRYNLAFLSLTSFDRTGDKVHLNEADEQIGKARAVFAELGAPQNLVYSDRVAAEIVRRRAGRAL